MSYETSIVNQHRYAIASTILNIMYVHFPQAPVQGPLLIPRRDNIPIQSDCQICQHLPGQYGPITPSC